MEKITTGQHIVYDYAYKASDGKIFSESHACQEYKKLLSIEPYSGKITYIDLPDYLHDVAVAKIKDREEFQKLLYALANHYKFNNCQADYWGKHYYKDNFAGQFICVSYDNSCDYDVIKFFLAKDMLSDLCEDRDCLNNSIKELEDCIEE